MRIITSLGSPNEPEEPAKPKTWEEQVAEYRVMHRKTLTRTATVMTLPLRAVKSVLVAASTR